MLAKQAKWRETHGGTGNIDKNTEGYPYPEYEVIFRRTQSVSVPENSLTPKSGVSVRQLYNQGIILSSIVSGD